MIRAAGEHGLLVETGSLELSHRLHAALRADQPVGVVEIVAGPRTVLIVAPGADHGRLRTHLAGVIAQERDKDDATPGDEAVMTIPVIYDGADLESVAVLAGISADEVISRHSGRELVVGWLGFAPGFAYLTGLDPVLETPRLDTPRTSVPAGSVAVAGPYSAVYPSASPGGWRLIGRTSVQVWDVTADPPSLFRPGMRVRFQPT
ncbi:5-oxoprolinase subunit B family protein [Nonomuraea jabiensis]|uniref:5-oxoprolinase subunit B family protein n=1 Tax=Nonomuraea jabiensis TaxID=882448 RepID=UPI0036A4151C